MFFSVSNTLSHEQVVRTDRIMFMMYLRLLSVQLLLILTCACGSGNSSKGPQCGNGVAEGDEPCDGTDLRGNSCASLGHYNVLGLLWCSSDCRLDRSECGGYCGDSIVDVLQGEQCDQNNFNGEDCLSMGYASGTLACDDSCRLDFTSCLGVCGDGIREGQEACDDGGILPGDGCSPDCQIETGWSCQGDTPSICTPICGDSLIVGEESCDGTNLGMKTCADFGFGGGDLECKEDCTLDTGACRHVCIASAILQCRELTFGRTWGNVPIAPETVHAWEFVYPGSNRQIRWAEGLSKTGTIASEPGLVLEENSGCSRHDMGGATINIVPADFRTISTCGLIEGRTYFFNIKTNATTNTGYDLSTN